MCKSISCLVLRNTDTAVRGPILPEFTKNIRELIYARADYLHVFKLKFKQIDYAWNKGNYETCSLFKAGYSCDFVIYKLDQYIWFYCSMTSNGHVYISCRVQDVKQNH